MNQEDVKRKTDEELLSVLARQHDYVSDIVALVREEIQARHLDSSRVQVPTARQLQDEEGTREFRSVKRSARVLALFELLIALSLLLSGLSSFSREPFVASSNTVLGAALLTLAIFSWLVRRWALLANAIVAWALLVLSVGGVVLATGGRVGNVRSLIWVGAGIFALMGLGFFQTWRNARDLEKTRGASGSERG